ncbi:MAG: hypothetical protein P8J37_12520 [Fuerstiella sp.]|nr:hypothetical protein [Fuerstiella sp.]
MTSKRHGMAIVLVTAGVGIVVTFAVLADPQSKYWLSGILLGAALSGSSVVFMRPGHVAEAHPLQEQSVDERSEFESWRQAETEELQAFAERLADRERTLAEQTIRFQEFSEYPAPQKTKSNDVQTTLRLSEADRRVRTLLEAEAERVYEKIRQNGYSAAGKIDADAIRTDVLGLIQRVAMVYSPESDNPLLETSFEDLARSASRICLHMLVLLEQLPVDIKRYNINEMYGYIQKAVQGYGAYQQVAPWLKYVTRGAYAGRMAAGMNPVTLGAWWVATELGRRGAQHVVENMVDRQAVAMLHDVVTVIGAEVSNIYGPGFRQRDAAWIFGTELTELLHQFPVSRESLSQALREVTALPLCSEYDRIYLYRCIAGHRSAGLRIEDPAMLSRTEREEIATKLETFFGQYIHGAEEYRIAWQDDLETRFDLKLSLSGKAQRTSLEEQAEQSLTSIQSFLTAVLNVPADAASVLVADTQLMNNVPLHRRTTLLNSLTELSAEAVFEPPNLDPAAPTTDDFLAALMKCAVASQGCDRNIQELLLETAAYFRRTHDEALALLDTTFQKRLAACTDDHVSMKKLPPAAVQQILAAMTSGETLAFTYTQIELQHSGVAEEHDGAVLFGLRHDDGRQHRTLLCLETHGVVWQHAGAIDASRRKGFLIDDCEIQGGEWGVDFSADAMFVSGSLTGGGYDKTFAPLLAIMSNSGPDVETGHRPPS